MSYPRQSVEEMESTLIGVKSLAKRRGWLINTLEKEKKEMMIVSSKVIVNVGGIEAIKKYRIELGIGDEAYLLTETKPYTLKKGRNKGKIIQAQFIGNTYCGHGTANKYVLAFSHITEANFDINWTVDTDTGLLKPIKKRIEIIID